MAIFDTFAKNTISLLIGVFSYGFLHSANLGQFSSQSILIRLSGDLYFLFFQRSEVRPKNRPFLKIFPWSPLCYFAKNGHFRHFCEKCSFSSNRCFFMRFFAQRKSRIVQLSIHTNQAIRRLVFLFFQPSEVRPKNRPFLKIFTWTPFAILRKMAIFDTFAKNVISLLIGVFSYGFLHSANLGQFSSQSILIRLSGDLYFLFFQPSEVRPKNRPFLKIFPWSPLCYFAKNGHFRHFREKCYFSSNRCFFMRIFAQRKSRIVQLSIHTNQAIRRLVFPILLAFRSSTKKSAIFENFHLDALCYFAKNGHFRHFCEKCYFSSNRCFFIRFFAQRKPRIVQLPIHTNQAIRRLVFPIFLAFRSSTKKSAIFENFPLVPSLLFCEKWPFSTLSRKMLFLF